MKKGSFVSFLTGIFVLISSLIPAQTTDQKTVRFEKNRKISRGQGVTVLKSRELNFQKKDFSLNLSKTKKSKRVYVNLKRPLTKALENKLMKDGIYLKEYVTNDTYIVELTENKLNKLRKVFSVRGFCEIEYSDKLSEILYENKFSAHAKDGTYVDVIVTFYKDISYDDAVSWVQSVGGIVNSKKFSRTHKLDVSIHQMNVKVIAELDVVKYVDEVEPPPQTHNIHAGYLSEVFWDNDSGLYDTGYSLTGLNVNVAIKDGGAIYSHSDFGSRLTIVDNDTVLDHATHVAGTVGGALDFQSNVGGMAENVTIYSYSYNVDGSSATTETDRIADFISALSYSASIVNNSWGATIGWKDDGTWSGTSNDYFGLYNSYAEDMDDFVYDYFDNDALLLKSAGNDRNDYEIGNQSNHDGTYYDNDGNYYDLIGPRGCSKNVVTIGSVGTGESDCDSSDFSSWGPTDDGRIKPDVVADGYYLRSTWDNDGYNSIPGTSMSCPVVTGICALIHQSYKDIYGEYPTADIVKALLCNFAEDLGKKGPDFAYGFGLVNAKKCIDAIENSDSSDGGHIVTGVIAEAGDYMQYQFTIGANETDNESVTLVWIDPAGSPSATNAIVNDLDISVSGHLPFYHKEYNDTPGVGTEEPTVDPTQEAKIGVNRYDTVEQVLIEPDNTGIIPAGTYTVTVSGFKVPVLNQPFAVVSSVGFNGIHYNVLKVKGQEGTWVSNSFSVLDKNPDILMKVTYADTSSYPTNVMYDYSNDGGTTWNDWQSVTGVYEDEACTELDNTSTPIAYIKKDNVPFDNISLYNNQVMFKLTYDGSVKESSVYVVKNDNTYYVSVSSGDDDENENENDGKGTQLNPWASIGYAIDHVVATSKIPAIIRVQEGTYDENIELEENIYLYGGYDLNWIRDIENNETIIDNDTTHIIVGADSSIIDGFTIQGGKAEKGGGIYLFQTSPTIENCTIKNNSAEDSDGSPAGAGIYAYDSEAIIKNCTITNNTTTVTEADNTGFGGGACFISSSILVENCIFEGNESTTTEDSYVKGGGIYLQADNSKIINSMIKSNEAYSSYAVAGAALGGGIYISEDSTSKLLGCIIMLNDTAPYYFGGDGIFLWDAPDTVITNCLVYGNTQDGIWAHIACCNITNTIIWNHSDDDLYGTLSSTKITYCDIEDGDYDGINGNIDDDPQFRDASSADFRLVNTSPCIDAGNDGAPSLDLITKDFQGQKRIFEYDNSGTESVDIGAYEYIFG
ncbi:S8 family serine peptidase, partial [bacterium]|nr:S8 family serine peptidase [bacterium]